MTPGADRPPAGSLPVELAALDRGTGPAVLLVHGVSFHSGPTWASTIGPLAAAGYRVLAVDRRGFGRSPAGGAGAIPVSLQAADLVTTLDLRDVPAAHLVGVSYGALVCLETALRYRRQVLSLTLIEPVLLSWLREDADYAPWVAHFDDLVAAGAAGAPYEEWLGPWLSLIDPAMAAALHPGAHSWAVVERALRHQFREESPTVYAPDTRRLAAMDLPTLVVNGSESEPALRAVADLLVARVPGAIHVEVSGAGHQLHIDQAEAFHRLLMLFLAGGPVGR